MCSSDLELKLEQIDVIGVMEEIARATDKWLAKRDVTLSIEVAEDAQAFTGDPKRVRQILQNLLANAIGFSPEGGTIRMGARRDGEEILVFVSDTGRGIEPEFQSRAFDRFQSKPMPGGHRGPGLGLAIVKSFVELHGGQVSLLSRVSKGTTIICRFPLGGPEQAKRAQKKAQVSGSMAAA